MKKEVIKTGVVAELNGKYWGTVYADGHCTCNAFAGIETADVSDPKYCRKPTDKTYNPKNTHGFNPDYEKLKEATLKNVQITIIYEVED